MKLGAEPKKVAMLVGLLVVAAGIFCFDYFSGAFDSPPPPTPAFLPYQIAPVKIAAALPAEDTRLGNPAYTTDGAL